MGEPEEVWVMSEHVEPRIPGGYERVECDVFSNGKWLVICGDPAWPELHQCGEHNCDEMGCTSVSHVIFKFRLGGA